MAVKKTKKLSEQTTTATVADGEKFAKVDANGNVTLINLANLKTALLGGIDINSMLDGVFIMYHAKSNDYPQMVKPHKWPDLQTAGEIADGVAVVEGGKVLVVAPTERTEIVWSSGVINVGITSTTVMSTALADWQGRTNTQAAVAKSSASAVTNTALYAPGFCLLYSRANANGAGLTAGKWWLPSVGELMMMCANRAKINYCLGLINGATPLGEAWYHSSTEYNNAYAWGLFFGTCTLDKGAKPAARNCARPVSTFLA